MQENPMTPEEALDILRERGKTMTVSERREQRLNYVAGTVGISRAEAEKYLQETEGKPDE